MKRRTPGFLRRGEGPHDRAMVRVPECVVIGLVGPADQVDHRVHPPEDLRECIGVVEPADGHLGAHRSKRLRRLGPSNDRPNLVLGHQDGTSACPTGPEAPVTITVMLDATDGTCNELVAPATCCYHRGRGTDQERLRRCHGTPAQQGVADDTPATCDRDRGDAHEGHISPTDIARTVQGRDAGRQRFDGVPDPHVAGGGRRALALPPGDRCRIPQGRRGRTRAPHLCPLRQGRPALAAGSQVPPRSDPAPSRVPSRSHPLRHHGALRALREDRHQPR